MEYNYVGMALYGIKSGAFRDIITEIMDNILPLASTEDKIILSNFSSSEIIICNYICTFLLYQSLKETGCSNPDVDHIFEGFNITDVCQHCMVQFKVMLSICDKYVPDFSRTKLTQIAESCASTPSSL